MNERLAHCVELTEMMSTNLNHKHGARLETIIIWLIAVEVGIEFLHLFEKYVIEKKETRTEEPVIAVVDWFQFIGRVYIYKNVYIYGHWLDPNSRCR